LAWPLELGAAAARVAMVRTRAVKAFILVVGVVVVGIVGVDCVVFFGACVDWVCC
jgi:hypothetical protein